MVGKTDLFHIRRAARCNVVVDVVGVVYDNSRATVSLPRQTITHILTRPILLSALPLVRAVQKSFQPSEPTLGSQF